MKKIFIADIICSHYFQKGFFMATRSTIIQRLKNGKYKSIYCHFDGYLSNNGEVLLSHYKNVRKVSKLMSLGNLSSLAKEVEAPEGGVHSYDKPYKDVTVAYCRDRNELEKDTKATINVSLKNSMVEYFSYLYFEGDWYIPLTILNDTVDEDNNDDDKDDDEKFNKQLINIVVTIENIQFALLKDIEEYIKIK